MLYHWATHPWDKKDTHCLDVSKRVVCVYSCHISRFPWHMYLWHMYDIWEKNTRKQWWNIHVYPTTAHNILFDTDRGTWTPTKHVHQNLNLICLPISSYPHMCMYVRDYMFFVKQCTSKEWCALKIPICETTSVCETSMCVAYAKRDLVACNLFLVLQRQASRFFSLEKTTAAFLSAWTVSFPLAWKAIGDIPFGLKRQRWCIVYKTVLTSFNTQNIHVWSIPLYWTKQCTTHCIDQDTLACMW